MSAAPTHIAWTGREATALRRAMGLTAERFAARLEVSPRTVAHWASNPATVPQTSVQGRLDVALRTAPGPVLDRFRHLTGLDLPAPTVDLAQVLAVLVDIHRSVAKLVEAR